MSAERACGFAADFYLRAKHDYLRAKHDVVARSAERGPRK
jgi:hypothetical protein